MSHAESGASRTGDEKRIEPPHGDHFPRTEEEWLDRKEQLARDNIQRAVVGLGQDLGCALHLPRETCHHPLVRVALERAGQLLTNDAVLDRIETSVVARVLPRGTAIERLKAEAVELFLSVSSKPSTDGKARASARESVG
jgi:hypothetical protein